MSFSNSMVRDIVTRWRGLHEQLRHVDSDPLVQRHPQTKSAKRTEVLAEWQEYIQPRLQQLRREELPKYIAERRVDTARARENLRAGRRPDANYKPFRAVEALDPDGLATVRHQALLTALSDLKLQQQIGNKLQLYSMMTTEQLQERVAAYERAAESGNLDNFPYAEFAADVEILPALLQSRSAADDPRAGFALQHLQNVEGALLRTAGFEPEPGAGAEERTLEQIEAAVNGLLADGRENLQALDGVMGPLSRAVERQESQQEQAVVA